MFLGKMLLVRDGCCNWVFLQMGLAGNLAFNTSALFLKRWIGGTEHGIQWGGRGRQSSGCKGRGAGLISDLQVPAQMLQRETASPTIVQGCEGRVPLQCDPPKSLEENNYYVHLNESWTDPAPGNRNIKAQSPFEGGREKRSVINLIENHHLTQRQG